MEHPPFFSTKARPSPQDLSPLLRIHPFSLSPRSKATSTPLRPTHTHRPTLRLPTDTKGRKGEGSVVDTPHHRGLERSYCESNTNTSVSPQRCKRISLHMKLVPLFQLENNFLNSSISPKKPDGRLIRYFRRRQETESRAGHPSVLLSADIPIPATAFSLEAVLSPAFCARFQ